MTSAAKLHKDKLYGSTPRLAPRSTVASVARTARITANRNLSSGTAHKSPSRHIATKPKPEAKSNVHQNEPCADDKLTKRRSDTDVMKILSSEQIRSDVEPIVAAPVEASLAEVCANDDLQLASDDPLNADGSESVDGQENRSDATRSLKDDDFKTQINSDSNQISIYSASEKSELEQSLSVSRPQTPKSGSNLPRSPRVPSRPTTPVKRTTRPATIANRPDTPRQSSLPRPRTSSVFKPPQTMSKTNTGQDDITVAFSAKQKEFHCMKKELDLKQKAILETFNMLKCLRDRMIKEGKIGQGEGLNQQELAIFNVADWAAEELAQLCHHSDYALEGAGEIFNTFIPIDEDFLSNWECKVLSVPGAFADLCIQAFTTRQELISWIKTILANQDEVSDEDMNRIATFNQQGVELCDILREVKTQADESLFGVTQLLKQTCQERGILITVGESLVKEIAHLQNDIALHNAADANVEPETAKALQDIRRELEEERAAKTAVRDKLSTTESQLRQARIRVNKMDRQLREAEASIASLTGTVKSLEDQSRQKEVQLEARARKLKESLKTGEMTNTHIIQERDALQNELANLKEQLERSMVENKATIHDLNNQLKELKLALETERTKKQEEIKIKTVVEESYRECLNTIDDLKLQIAELERKKQSPDLPSEKEVELRAELTATKETLRIAEEEMISCKHEKVRFLETLAKIAETENKVVMQQKLETELLNKEEIMGKMQAQIRDLTKSIKLNEQKVIQYKQYVRNMQVYTQATESGEDNSNAFTFQELQQEIMHLRMRLLEAVHRNEELTEMLMQKDQQLEQQSKTSRAQAKDIKVREELINMLQNKETEQSRELSMLQQDLANRMKVVEEVNKQIASKAEEIQELFSSLESKQQQIHRLEKIVLALEEQQRRAQAQRTRQEEKIAALEHELAAGCNNRERKFLFF